MKFFRFDVESKHGAFFTGGNVEWLTENRLICQKETSLQILDIETGSVCNSIAEDSTEDVDIIHTFTSNESSIVTAHKSGLLKLWKHDGTLEKTWKAIHKGPVSKMCLNSSEKLVTGGSDGSVRLWDLKHHACLLNLKGCEGVISVVIYHPIDNVLFATGDDTKINSWGMENGEIKFVYNGHFSKVTSIVFHHDNKNMISTGRDKVIILWDVSKGVSVRTIPVFETLESLIALPRKFKVSDIKINEGIFVATAGEEGAIKIWDLHNSKLIYKQSNQIISPAKEVGGLSIIKILYNPNLKIICIVTVDHNIILHNLKTFDCVKQFVGFTDEILDVCFIGKDDSYLAIATNSPDIKLYENSTMNCQLLRGHTDIVLSLNKTNANPNLLLSSSKDNTIRLWKLNDDNKMISIAIGSKHTNSVGSVAFSQLSTAFAVSVSQDTCLKMWEITLKEGANALECTRTEIAHHKDINVVTVSPNDKIIATGSQDKHAKLWSDSLELLGTLRGHKRGIWCVRFSPIDQIVITSSADCTVKLWSVLDLNCLKTLEGHDSSVLKTEFLSNGMQILTSGADGFLKLFNVKTSECVATLDQHDGRVWALAVKQDETVIVSGGSDSLLVKWKDVTSERKLEKIKQEEELLAQEQQLNNLVHSNDLLKALKLALKLDRPLQTLKIIRGIIKTGNTGLEDAVKELNQDQKDSLMKCVTVWNTNSKNAQPAQLVLNILINDMQLGDFRPAGLGNVIESTLPYTERHFKRLTTLLQDLYLVDYTINCMQPHAKMNND